MTSTSFSVPARSIVWGVVAMSLAAAFVALLVFTFAIGYAPEHVPFRAS
jgi:hypothetical protein